MPERNCRVHSSKIPGLLGLAVTLAATAFLLTSNQAIGMPDSIRIPIVEEHGPKDPPDAALFSHWNHDGYQCYACHPAVFPKRKMGFTHKQMEDGRFCGSCHNGVEAWNMHVASADCESCHVPVKPPEEVDLDDLFGLRLKTPDRATAQRPAPTLRPTGAPAGSVSAIRPGRSD